MTLPVPANALRGEPDLLGAFGVWLAARNTVNESYLKAARHFFARWPDPTAWAAQPLEARLRLNPNQRVVVNWLILYQDLHPGYDWLVAV
jgi:hypothetical protein